QRAPRLPLGAVEPLAGDPQDRPRGLRYAFLTPILDTPPLQVPLRSGPLALFPHAAARAEQPAARRPGEAGRGADQCHRDPSPLRARRGPIGPCPKGPARLGVRPQGRGGAEPAFQRTDRNSREPSCALLITPPMAGA